MIEVFISDTFQIEGRGTVFVVKQEDNQIPLMELAKREIIVNGEKYLVRAIESHAIWMSEPRVVGLLVRKLND